MTVNEAESNAKIKVAITSVFAALFLTVTKLSVGLSTNSLAILAEAAHSGLDMVAAIITLIAVYLSKNPADLDHNFGHGKVENFSALNETLILIITCGWIIFEAMNRLVHHTTPEVTIYSFGVVFLAIFIDYERSRMLFRIAKRTRSQALQADALHFSTDILSSSVVVVGLIFVKIGFTIGDTLAALMVAMIVIWISVRLGKSTINALMDKVPFEQYDIITKFCNKEYPEYEIKRLRLRESGPNFIGDLTILIPSDMPVTDFHRVSEAIHTQLVALIPNLDLMINAHPKEEKTQVKILNFQNVQKAIDSIKLPDKTSYLTHNLTVYKNGNTNNLDLDLELPNDLTLSESYNLLQVFENQLKERIPDLNKIRIHLEPLSRTKTYFKPDTTDKNWLQNKIIEILKTIPEVLDIESIELNGHKGRLIIHLTIQLDGSQSLEKAHLTTYLIEAKIFQKIPNIDKIFIHYEPFTINK